MLHVVCRTLSFSNKCSALHEELRVMKFHLNRGFTPVPPLELVKHWKASLCNMINLFSTQKEYVMVTILNLGSSRLLYQRS